MASARRCASPKGCQSEGACGNIVKTAHFSTPDGPGAPPGRVVQAGREPPQGRWTGCPGNPGSQHQRGKCSKGRKSRPTRERIVRIARLETRNCNQEHPERHPGRIARRPRRPSGGVYIAIQNMNGQCSPLCITKGLPKRRCLWKHCENCTL